MSPALSFENVTLRYGERIAASDVSLTVEHGEVLCLLGSSGCGKSSLIRLVLGLVAPNSGRIQLGGIEASTHGRVVVPPERRGLAVVFQDLALWPHLSVEAHLRFVLAARGIARHERGAEIDAMLARVGLHGRHCAYPAQLSGGERQRLAIARALVVKPQVILLDEPLSNLDLALKCELLAVFRNLFADRRISAVYVTHDVREAAFLGTRIAVMEHGQIAAVGPLEDLRTSLVPAVRRMIEGLAWSGEVE